MTYSPEIIAKFWSKTNAAPSGCVLWIGASDKKGYGMFWANGKGWRAHRFSYVLAHGELSEELTIDHLCRVPGCVNPHHLEAVSSKTNTLRGYGISAQNKRKTHCKRGHEFTPENTRTQPYRNGLKRECRKCYLDRERRCRLQEARKNPRNLRAAMVWKYSGASFDPKRCAGVSSRTRQQCPFRPKVGIFCGGHANQIERLAANG